MRVLYSLVFLVVGSIIFFTNITFAPRINQPLLITVQMTIILVLLLAYVFFKKTKNEAFRDITFSFLTASAALTVLHFVPVARLGFSINTPQGLAMTKLFESLVIIGVILVMFKLAGYHFNTIYITKGKLLAGLIIGTAAFAGMIALGPPIPVEINIFDFYLKYLPWLLIFVFSNAATEELLFRGIFLKKMKAVSGAASAIIVSSIVFALAHMQVTYQSPSEIIGFMSMVFILALLWGFITYRTGSLIASIFFHAGADMVIMISIYQGAGIII